MELDDTTCPSLLNKNLYYNREIFVNYVYVYEFGEYSTFNLNNLFYWTIVNTFEIVLLQLEILKCEVKHLPQ